MENTVIKIDENTIEILKPVEIVEPTKIQYERGFIENQIVQIQKTKDEFDTLRDAEIKECMDILMMMDKVGIISKPIDVKLEDIPIEEIIS